jgi:hypothetical protein
VQYNDDYLIISKEEGKLFDKDFKFKNNLYDFND